MQAQSEQRVFSYILNLPENISKLKRLNDKFFSKKDNREVFKLLNSGITSIEEIVENFPHKDQERIEEYLNTRKADSWPVPVERIQQVIDLNHKKRLEKLITKHIDKEVKTGKYDFEKILELRQKIEYLSLNDFKCRSFADIESRPLEWYWFNKIPANSYSQIFGDPDAGKSLLTIYMTSKTTTGKDWPDQKNDIKGSVALIQFEDTLSDTVKPRLEAAGADHENVYHPKYSEIENIDGILEYLKKLKIKLKDSEKPDLKLAFIDCIDDFMQGAKGNDTIEVRGKLIKIQDFCQQNEMTIIGVKHSNKDSSKKAIYRVTGSMAYTAVARSSWLVQYDREQNTRSFIPQKANICRNPTGLEFIIEGPIGMPQIKFKPEPINTTADEALADEETKDRYSAKSEAQDFINEVLRQGKVKSQKILDEAKKEGIAIATLKRAKSDMKVKSFKEGGEWFWELSKQETS